MMMIMMMIIVIGFVTVPKHRISDSTRIIKPAIATHYRSIDKRTSFKGIPPPPHQHHHTDNNVGLYTQSYCSYTRTINYIIAICQ